jgi:hypothetical protein
LNDPKQSSDYRRTMALKTKNLQFERQVQLLISASELRAELVNDAENYALELQQSITDDNTNELLSSPDLDVQVG